MGTIWQDLRYGLRMLVKRPGFTAVAVVALALGIGANTAIFSVVNSVLLRPLPYPDSDRIARVYTTIARRDVQRYPMSYLNFADIRDQSTSFEHVAAHASTGAAFRTGDTPESVEGVIATADLFPLLGVEPQMGRVFTREEEGPDARVVVISHEMWQKRFGGDRAIVGREFLLDGEATTVLGVMPEGFRFPVEVEGPEYWQPINPRSESNEERGASYLSVIARVKPNVTQAQAQAELDAVAARLAEQYPDRNAGRGARLVPAYEAIVGDIRPALLTLLAAVGFVLLIACANVANLMLARAASRRREIAVRTALGASRWRIVRQLLTESLMLALAGGAAGLLLAWWGVDVLSAFVPADIPRVKEIALDRNVLLFTLGVSALTGVVFGLAPALNASKAEITESLKEGGRGTSEGFRSNRLRGLLVVTEVALSLVLLVGAGLLIRSFYSLNAVSPGFETRGVLTGGVALPTTKYREEAQQAAFFERVLERVKALPGVEAAGGVEPLPMSGNGWQTGLDIEGRPPAAPGERLTSHTRVVSPDYHRAMGIPLLRGRALDERDTADAPKVIVVNETFVKKYFPGEDPIGRRVTPTIARNFTAEIVGVVGDVKHQDLETEVTPEYYASYRQAPQPFMTLVVRGRGDDPSALTAAVRGAVLEVDANQPLYNVKPMSEWMSQTAARRRFNTGVLAVFAGVALLLAGVGIFGVMNYSVTRRTHELGVRMALGAQGRDVFRLVVGQGMGLVAAGVVIGLVGALVLTRFISSLLFGVSASDPVTFAGVALVLAAVALLACYVPARRATKVDPMVALRYE
ncbi:MAG TPA: ABC transporter permease [Pyrinomonadaceae bacterium]|nr:ABC transporter permease [Pyrinomonadaceae bacterium]